MSVVGIGTDIVEITRFKAMSIGAKERLAKRVLTPSEYEKYCSLTTSDAFLAKRWAGKEAAAKALGFGIANGISFQHIHIKSLETGQPVLDFTDRALEVAKHLSANSFHISLSDEKNYATAFVVLSQ